MRLPKKPDFPLNLREVQVRECHRQVKTPPEYCENRAKSPACNTAQGIGAEIASFPSDTSMAIGSDVCAPPTINRGLGALEPDHQRTTALQGHVHCQGQRLK